MQLTVSITLIASLLRYVLSIPQYHALGRRHEGSPRDFQLLPHGLGKGSRSVRHDSQLRLERREPKHKGGNQKAATPAAQARPKSQPKPPNPQQQAKNARKAQQNAANAEKKAKAQSAKTEKQKQKDIKHVNDNMYREKKAQDRAGRDAMKNLANVEKGTARDKNNENRRYANDQQRLKKNLANSERQLAKEKGKKGFGNAQKQFSQAQASLSNASNQHKARLGKVYASSTNAMNRDRGKLDKALTKAHTSEFDANGRAKDHPSALAKFGKVMSYLGPAMLSVVPGVGGAMLGAMTGARVASIAAQQAAKEGTKQGIKQGTKQGIKQGTKKGGAALVKDWKVQSQDQIAASQKVKDIKIDAFEQQRKKLTAGLRS